MAIHWVLLICLALSALTLLFPSTPTYDPWAWLLWGREILHLDLVTDGGPSWKPLPVMFNVPFSIFGVEAAPYLWLWIARAGALLALAMSFRLARRLVGRGAAGCGGRRVRRRVPADHLPVRARLGAGQLRGAAGRAVPVGLRAPPGRPPRPRALPGPRLCAAAARGVAVPGPVRPVAVRPRTRAAAEGGAGRPGHPAPVVRPGAVGLGRAVPGVEPGRASPTPAAPRSPTTRGSRWPSGSPSAP